MCQPMVMRATYVTTTSTRRPLHALGIAQVFKCKQLAFISTSKPVPLPSEQIVYRSVLVPVSLTWITRSASEMKGSPPLRLPLVFAALKRSNDATYSFCS